LYNVEIWALRKVDQKHLECFNVWYWRRMEMISCTDRVKSGNVLHRGKEWRNMLHIIQSRKADWMGHTLRTWLQIHTGSVCCCCCLSYKRI
jgi:hypothetical protein